MYDCALSGVMLFKKTISHPGLARLARASSKMAGFCRFLVGDLNFLIGKVQKILLATSVEVLQKDIPS